MWSRSQPRESLRQPGKTQWASRSRQSSRIAAGGSCWSTANESFRSRTGRTITRPANLASQSANSCSVAAPSFSILTGTGLVGVEVHEQVHRTPTRAGCPLAARHEVQCVLRVGQDPDRPGPPDVDWVRVTELPEFTRDAADGLVEEQRVGGVQGHRDVGAGGVAAVS